MGRQLAIDFGMQPNMMAHVDEISFFCANTLRSCQRDMLWCVECGCGRKAFITKTSNPCNCSYEASGIVSISVTYPKRPPIR